ncbi:hypothetical protein C5167_022570 [Papaver somniferum]|uniref:Wax synthase domain-containing protein n=1 Tax=Papaver somniferum TaxID=3469 RepID=A0A4Y7JLA8_PAPSO|nr:hypothetical protein C5167_022570 [Papaver somniferum]
MLLIMEDESKNLIKVFILVSVSLSYTYFIVGKNIPKGKIRFLSLLPVFYYFTVLPLTISSIVVRGTLSFFITWLANFKLILFSFGQGPLSSDQSFISFVSVCCLPVNIRQDSPLKSLHQTMKIDKTKTLTPKNSKKPLLSLPVIIFLGLLVLHVYCNHKQSINPSFLLVLYLYLFLEILLALGATLARVMLGSELEPQSNEPYLSTSLQDFWGKRWNLMVSSILRPTVYHPVCHMSAHIFGRNWASVPAVLATFVVSGLMHEQIFYYMNNMEPTWEVTFYFVIHGICTAKEVGMKKALNGKWQLHRLVSGPLTLGFVVVTTMWYFLPPALRSGSDLGIKEFGSALEFFEEKLISNVLTIENYGIL